MCWMVTFSSKLGSAKIYFNYRHLRVFNYREFVHIPKDERGKLESQSKECIFLGMIEKKLVRSRDVISFEE